MIINLYIRQNAQCEIMKYIGKPNIISQSKMPNIISQFKNYTICFVIGSAIVPHPFISWLVYKKGENQENKKKVLVIE